MEISVIGTGYVGLVTGTCFAELGHKVNCLDIDEAKIAKLKSGQCPIYEPGLEELLERNISNGRLNFSVDPSSIKNSQSIFIAVGTPSDDEGSADLSYLYNALESLSEFFSHGASVVIKSTVPVGTGNLVKAFLKERRREDLHIVNNPEFLREGQAVQDFMHPDRIVVGLVGKSAKEIMEELYRPLVKEGSPFYVMSNISAEMTKYASNCFLAIKISYINELARFCDSLGADIDEVRLGMTSDKRIGKEFFYPGPGYGGSCFPKDVMAFMHTAKKNDLELKIVEAAQDVNNEQKIWAAEKILHYFDGDLMGKTFSFWGVAFKPNTDDVRESSAIFMARFLIDRGAKVNFFDPVASENFLHYFPDKKKRPFKFDNKYDVLDGSHCLFLITDWPEFNSPDFNEIVKRMESSRVLFDCRNIIEGQAAVKAGMTYFSLGKRP